jgi:anaerobic ribonucleoside-triphosphate reductase activating protein
MSKGLWIAAIREGFQDIPGIITLDVFTVGCKHKCPGCHTQQLQDPRYPGRRLLTLLEAKALAAGASGLIGAVCWMGGDPLYQEQELLPVIEAMRAVSPVPHVLFTGDEFEVIDGKVLELVDAAITGRWEGIPVYEEGTNQRIMLKGPGGWKQATKEELVNHLTQGN